jgi:SAM-dependent methyltransferase
MTARSWEQVQREYYDRHPHGHLQPSAGGAYAENLVAKLGDALALGEDAEGIEIGCGAGRFTLPLLARCRTLQAVDLSRRQLDVLAGELRRRGIAPERCAVHEADVARLDGVLPPRRYDFATGVFVLHHLRDPEATIERLRRLVRPGGRVGFIEPNRRNPLFLLQIGCCRDMTWREEWLLYRLGARRLHRMFVAAGLADVTLTAAGFFPPQLVNRSAAALRLERRLEGVRWLRPLLPFLLVSGRVPGG